jgi:hypothetical protein
MKADKLHKFMDFMMNVSENTEIQMYGKCLLNCLISYLSLQLFKIKYFVYMEVFHQVLTVLIR